LTALRRRGERRIELSLHLSHGVKGYQNETENSERFLSQSTSTRVTGGLREMEKK
jgi:hypothetical protein